MRGASAEYVFDAVQAHLGVETILDTLASQVAAQGHWGQWFMNTRQVAERWWGTNAIESWKAARADLLPTAAAQAIFASPILTSAGLG